MPKSFHIVCLEPGSDNPIQNEPVPDSEPPEGFVDNVVYRYKLDENGNKVLIGTMPAFPEDIPKEFKKGEDKMSKDKRNPEPKREDREEIMAKVRGLVAESKTIAEAARILGVLVSTIYTWQYLERKQAQKAQKQTPDPTSAQVGSQEPKQEAQEPANQSVAQEKPEITVKETYEDLAKQEREQQGFGPEDEEPIPYQVVGKYEALGKAIGALVDEKNLQYGDAFNRGGCILEILYPDGVRPNQYRDMLGVIRVIDKLFRVANGKQGREDPWQDIAGYGLLGTGEEE